MRFSNMQKAREFAEAVSKDQRCTQHINAHCAWNKDKCVVEVRSYEVSDWFVDGSTLMSYTNGRQQD